MGSVTSSAWFLSLSVVGCAFAAGYLFRRVILHGLARMFARTTTDLDDIVLAACRRHIPLWFLLGGAAIGARLAPISPELVTLVDRVCAVALVISLSLAASAVGVALLGSFARRAGANLATTSLFQNLLRMVIIACGGILALANLGMSITPLLATLGVGSLAVALALQPTLANLFAGLHLAVARPIRVGDFVELETGTKGHVVDIGWRATRIRDLPNNLIVIPNARLADMVLTNYEMPEPEQAVLVQVGVAYGSDLESVERITCEVARETLAEVQGGVPEFEPFIRYHTFGESSIDLSVILRSRQFVDRYLLTHEFIKRLQRRYAVEGIEIPFPQRVVHAPGGAVPGASLRTWGRVATAEGR